MQTNLKNCWTELAFRYSSNEALIATLWTEIETCHSAAKRHYHNLSHLNYMAEKAIVHKCNLADFDAVLFAIFYHDIVYDVKRQDNEQQSALVAQKRLTELGVADDKIAKCFNMILATKEHQTHEDTDTNYLVDFDLAILGETTDSYRLYTQKIRKEYALYPNLVYKPGRKKVLQHFLTMKRIFNTEEFYQECESQARENMRLELSELRKSSFF